MRRVPPSLMPMLMVLAAVAAGCSASSATALAAQGLERGEDGWYGIPVTGESHLPDVEFEDVDGDVVSLADFAGDPTLLFFGYTSCPDICPVHLAAITSSMSSVEVGFDELDVVFVSVDPERDTPRRIREFVANFDEEITGLHADVEVVEEALADLDLGGPVVQGADPRGEGDLIGHPAQVIGFDSDGQARRSWPFGARRSDWVSDLPRIVEQW